MGLPCETDARLPVAISRQHQPRADSLIPRKDKPRRRFGINGALLARHKRCRAPVAHSQREVRIPAQAKFEGEIGPEPELVFRIQAKLPILISPEGARAL